MLFLNKRDKTVFQQILKVLPYSPLPQDSPAKAKPECNFSQIGFSLENIQIRKNILTIQFTVHTKKVQARKLKIAKFLNFGRVEKFQEINYLRTMTSDYFSLKIKVYIDSLKQNYILFTFKRLP